LNLRPVLEKLLDDIVTKYILNELQSIVRDDLIEDTLFLLRGGCLKLLLNEARSVLITTKLDNIAIDIPKLPLARFVRSEFVQ
jgi:hypothetical protein